MQIGIFGSGYVGLVSGACLAKMGHTVILVDTNIDRVAELQKGIVPIYEPGLEELLASGIAEKKISFTSDGASAIKQSEVLFIAVGTPMMDDGTADLKYVRAVAETIGANATSYKVIVDKSTVPVGTGDLVTSIISAKNPSLAFDVVSNPEFLREGSAIDDFMRPDRIVVGSASAKAAQVMSEVYAPLTQAGFLLIHTDVKSAEIIKYAANAMLATRISFINMISELCEKVGADVQAVSLGMGTDSRIGKKFLVAGPGYGGSCFPKDVNAFIQTLNEKGCDASILEAVEEVNAHQKESVYHKVLRLVPNLRGKKIAILGGAFKANTDDIRESPSLTLVDFLTRAGAEISLYDPKAEENLRKVLPNITYAQDIDSCISGASCLVIMTEWDEFKTLNMQKVKTQLREPNIVDARNLFYTAHLPAQGFKYLCIGKATKA